MAGGYPTAVRTAFTQLGNAVVMPGQNNDMFALAVMYEMP